MNKRASLAAAIVLSAILALAAPLAASAQTVIDTTGDAAGAAIGDFGPTQTPTYGQTVVTPTTDTVLTRFGFMVSGDADVVFRAQAFAWDSTVPTATGAPLFTSAATTLATSGGVVGSDGFTKVAFDTGGLELLAGQSYVLLLTTGTDAQPASPGSQIWGYPTDDGDAATGFVYSNDAPGDPTGFSWDTGFSDDSAYFAVFETPIVVSALTPATASTAGGSTVVITGTGFIGALGVNFGTVAATSFVVDSDTQITAVTPALVAGTTPVTVVGNGLTSAVSAASAFTAIAPIVTIAALDPELAATGADPLSLGLAGLTLLLLGLGALVARRIASRG